MPGPRSLRSISISRGGGKGPGPMSTTSTRPTSPALTETTNASQMNFGFEGPDRIITRADLKNSALAFENLLAASAGYREALMHMSKASSTFADALQNCANLKGTSDLSCSRFQVSSGLHHLMGNHWHILSDSIEKKFERPLQQYLEAYRADVAERSQAYERILREKSRIIRQTEKENMNVTGKKHRNLRSFREALAVLQRQVEELDEMRADHYHEVLQHEEEVWDFVQGKVSVVIRTTLDVIDRITTKSSDPVLEPMLQAVPDPFDAYGPPKAENQIFSILAPLAIFNGSGQSTETLALGNPAEPAMTEINPTDVFAVGAGPGGSPTPGAVGTWGNEFVDHGMNGVDHNGTDDPARPWGDSKTPTSSPPPSVRGVASSSSSVTTVQRSKSPPPSTSTPRRGTFPPNFTSASGSGVSLSTSIGAASSPQSQQRLRSEAKLRNVLSAISEKSGHSRSSSSISSRGTTHSQSSSSSGGHDREASHDTLRASRLPRDLTDALSEQDSHEADGWSSDMFQTGASATVKTGDSNTSLPESSSHTE
ncbi:hypothetical protein SCHPADRAFT_849174 [Schizopora paradoxa]|uniref:IMD domain-containing protein n=1 Tax=Schizopora paradoxa TaxID=27342 RepID=A0A0H2SF08_9AGAM|nr:hypothetical protein SCHPADRAFT_849174 [Schizopora paradoxa]